MPIHVTMYSYYVYTHTQFIFARTHKCILIYVHTPSSVMLDQLYSLSLEFNCQQILSASGATTVCLYLNEDLTDPQHQLVCITVPCCPLWWTPITFEYQSYVHVHTYIRTSIYPWILLYNLTRSPFFLKYVLLKQLLLCNYMCVCVPISTRLMSCSLDILWNLLEKGSKEEVSVYILRMYVRMCTSLTFAKYALMHSISIHFDYSWATNWAMYSV